MATTIMNPRVVLQECAEYAYENDLTEPWLPFYNAAMKKIVGLSTTGAGRQRRRSSTAAKQARNRGPSKIVQAILAVLPAEGMPKREILKAVSGMTATKFKTAQTTFEKGVHGYIKNGRYFAGPNPAKATDLPAPPRTRAAKEPTGLSNGVLTAVGALPPGSTNAQVVNHLATNLGMKAAPHHVGIALQRHRRAGRLEQRDGVWYTPAQEELRPTG